MKYLLLLIFLVFTMPVAAAEVITTSDIPYGEAPLQNLDIYSSPECKQTGCPVVMWVHGGGWVMNDKTDRGCRNLCNAWAKQGMVVVSINYRLSPTHKHPAHVEDVAAAINWTKTNIASYGGNPAKLYLLGHSAGGHLISLVATAPEYLAKYDLAPAKDISGVFSIDAAAYDLTNQRYILGQLITVSFGADTKTLLQASPLLQIKPTGKYPPFIMVAIRQRMPFLLQAQSMVLALKATGASAERLIVDYPNEHTEIGAHMRLLSDLGNITNRMTKRLIDTVKSN